MIYVCSWKRVKRFKTTRSTGEPFRVDHFYTGWFLFGVIPIYIKRDSTWHTFEVRS